MSQTIPAAAVALLVILAVLAKERHYEMTSAALVVLTCVLVGWFAAIVWMFG
jgi:hypothetical protein